MKEHLQKIFKRFRGTENELIPVLQAVQEELGYLPEESMQEIAAFLRVPESRVYAVASFYAQFRFTPIGRNHVMVCRGTACHVRGAPRIIETIERELGIAEGETTEDMEFSYETVACIGACGLAPNLTVNKDTHGRLTVKKVTEIIDHIRALKAGDTDD